MRAPLSTIRSGRRAAVAKMIDRCRVTRGVGEPDEVTGVTPTVVVYAGACKVQTQDQYEQKPEAGGYVHTVQRYYVHIPVGAYQPAVGDVVEIQSAALDPGLVGRELRVVGLLHKSFATAYRLAVQDDVTGQAGA